MAEGLVDHDHLRAKASIVLARGLGETPQIESQDVPLYVQDFLKSKGMKSRDIRSYDSAFGRVVSKAYLDRYGMSPKALY
ncbi:hypothetical protein A583_04403 [Corynebacterium glutamicum Z188]|uniref:Integrase n=1 Tax=Corynebacterium glutamicum TaxID=1718 RepID=A0AB36I7V0_CORGT|nr:hypothetical protein CgS9114_12901 [Corynebacterium glutamicum S9114]EPP41315.1 hypothetical protein A583_04403 [Corynebacterium glutamicum Z188]OKX76944.1 hypothetical protein AUP69_14675 [Corynebacterium glutamicum]OKX77641.1 hypothetical protein AUP70_10160 [Corynebacterium glutamicum]TWS50081.1 hypothetical protein AKJ22_03835 [Corynebacterium glutamicum]